MTCDYEPDGAACMRFNQRILRGDEVLVEALGARRVPRRRLRSDRNGCRAPIVSCPWLIAE